MRLWHFMQIVPYGHNNQDNNNNNNNKCIYDNKESSVLNALRDF